MTFWTDLTGSERARFVLGIIAAALFAWAGAQMYGLRSQADERTVAELFDNYVGIFAYGMAFLSLLAALPARSTPPP